MGEKFQIWNPSNYLNDMDIIDKNLSENNLEEELYGLLDLGNKSK